jgi:hypothetical protein
MFVNSLVLLSLFALFAIPLVFGICLTMYGFGCICQAIGRACK